MNDKLLAAGVGHQMRIKSYVISRVHLIQRVSLRSMSKPTSYLVVVGSRERGYGWRKKYDLNQPPFSTLAGCSVTFGTERSHDFLSMDWKSTCLLQATGAFWATPEA